MAQGEVVTGAAADAAALPWLLRDRREGLVAGIGAGLAPRLGVEALVVRVAFVVLTAAGGAGLAGYLLVWLLTREGGADELAALPRRRVTVERTAAVALVVTGVLLLLREAGLWFGDAIGFAVALAGAGSALLWSRAGAAERTRLGGVSGRVPRDPFEAVFTGRVSPVRIIAGGALVAVGMASVLALGATLATLASVALAVGVTAGGLLLILGPWLFSLARDLAEERRERIRSEERAEVAAHLHDSVLQTLTLIQRADAPPDVVALARAQERELRAWLQGRPAHASDTLAGALRQAAARAEERHRVPIEVVVVGDLPLDDRLRALTAAAAEAMTNAARHGRAPRVDVYAEVEEHRVTCYVADEGVGFDPSAVPAGRRGISESIVGRMQRHGGSATVTAAPGAGTEVALELPRSGT
jgi:signal transduction histidine kinase